MKLKSLTKDHRRQLRQSVKCVMCGTSYWDYVAADTRIRGQRAKQEHLCPECYSWGRMLKKYEKVLEIVDGVAYAVYPKAKKKMGTTLGGGGVLKYIVKPDGTCVESNDIWTLGTLPERIAAHTQNTGWWTIPKSGRNLVNYPFKCQNKFCFDRYYCFRYDYHQEFDVGPKNVPPLTWQRGAERCQRFVDISTITNYPYFDINDLHEETT